MNTKHIITIGFLFLFACSTLYGQASDPYFNKKTTETLTFLRPKGYHPKSTEGSSNYRVRFNQQYVETAYPYFHEIFGDVNLTDEELHLTKWIHYSFWFDKKFSIYYFSITYPNKLLYKLPELEEKLYKFGVLYQQQMNISPFIEIFGKDLPKGGSINTVLYVFFQYRKDPSKIRYLE